jgi:hypothetical protein
MAARSNAVITEPTERELAIERVFDAPRELSISPDGSARKVLAARLSPANCERAGFFARTCVGPTARIIGNTACSAKSFRRSVLSGPIAGRTLTAGRRGPRPC